MDSFFLYSILNYVVQTSEQKHAFTVKTALPCPPSFEQLETSRSHSEDIRFQWTFSTLLQVKLALPDQPCHTYCAPSLKPILTYPHHITQGRSGHTVICHSPVLPLTHPGLLGQLGQCLHRHTTKAFTSQH